MADSYTRGKSWIHGTGPTCSASTTTRWSSPLSVPMARPEAAMTASRSRARCADDEIGVANDVKRRDAR